MYSWILFALLAAVVVDFGDSNRHGPRSRQAVRDYEKIRQNFVDAELGRSLGSGIILNAEEHAANAVLMEAKNSEIAGSLDQPYNFNPSHHIFSVFDRISESRLFKMIERMPKGAVLHSHDTSMASTEFLIELTYRENLWICLDGELSFNQMRFSRSMPRDGNCQWALLSHLRRNKGARAVDDALRSRFTIFPREEFRDTFDVWSSFGSIFGLTGGLFAYAPVWKDYFYHVFGEYLADGIHYIEIRSVMSPLLYDLDRTYPQSEILRITKEAVDEFKADHPEFIGAKMIFSPQRSVNNSAMAENVRAVIDMKEKFPDFLAGFDIVFHEEKGRPLKDFIPQLLEVPADIPFYFHAGESGWLGTQSDENVIDAVLLGSKRIGHGYSIVKHPDVLEAIKEQDIAVEVCPISNQVLQMVGKDYRNHPAVHLLADDYPVVISSDDRSFFGTKPLSHDFYIAFLGLASAHADIRMLKQLAINSIKYSALKHDEKNRAMYVWQAKWNEYIRWLAEGAR